MKLCIAMASGLAGLHFRLESSKPVRTSVSTIPISMKPYLLVLENFQSLRERTEIPISNRWSAMWSCLRWPLHPEPTS